MDFPILVPSKKAEQLLGLAPNTLAVWRSKGVPNQPPFIELGARAIRYELGELRQYLKQQSRTIGGAK